MKREELLILLIILLFVQGYLLRNVFSALLAFFILVYLTYLRSEFFPRIKVKRIIDKNLVEGVKVISKLKLKNTTNKRFKVSIVEKFLPIGFKAEIPDDFILNENEEKEVKYHIIPVRGTYKIKSPIVRVKDLRELYYVDFISDEEVEIEVYPSIDKIREDVKTERIDVTTAKALIGLQSLDIHSLRKYQYGDDLKFVDWKATARLRELIVKDFLKETESDVYIILDVGREMRKGIKNSKIDYATTLALQLVYALRDYRVGIIIYDDFGVKRKVEPSKYQQIEKIVKSLRVSPIHLDLISTKLSEISFKLSKESRDFIKKVLPIIKGRRSFSTGLIEAISSIPSPSFLIFISDITAHTSELVKVLSELKKKHRILLLTPNPILFYDESKLDREKILWLYKRYIEREELIKKLNKIVPTLDLGPSDLIDLIKEAIKC